MGGIFSSSDDERGPRGPPGSNGIQGVRGPAGSNGDRGPPGSNGAQGIQGIQGIQGPAGSNGAQGIQGIQGLAGSNGLPGSNGTNGLDGLPGSNGAQGIQGIQGIQGPPGSNAQAITLTSEEFMYQAQGPLMGLLASVGVNSTSYRDYFENSANSNTRIKLASDVEMWKTYNSPLTQDKVLKFANFYVCWIKGGGTDLIPDDLPFTCYSQEADSIMNSASLDKIAFFSAVSGQILPILETTYGIDLSKVVSLSQVHKRDIGSRFIVYCNNWMNATGTMNNNGPLMIPPIPPATSGTPIPAKVTEATNAVIAWLQTNTNFLTVTPFRSGPTEPFRNYTFKGVLPPSRLSYVDYHSYE